MIRGYSRVSTQGQARDGNSLEAQREALIKAGAEIIYTDVQTGARIDRPQLRKLLDEVQEGDTVVVCKLDRMARSIPHGVGLVKSLMKRGVKINVLNIGELSDSPTGRLICSTMFAIAEFERDLISARCEEGRAIARMRADYRDGRPPEYGKAQKDHALELLRNHSYSQVSRMTGMSKSTIIRYKNSRRDIVEQDDGKEV